MGEKNKCEIGKLYDTVFFITTFLFESVMKERLSPYASDIEEDFKFYYELKNTIPPIDAKFSAFCYCDKENDLVSFLIKTLSYEISYSTGTLDDFMSVLSNTYTLKKNFINYYLFKTADEVQTKLIRTYDTLLINETLDEYSYSDLYKRHFMVTLTSFESLLPEFRNVVSTVYSYIDEAHKAHVGYLDGMKNYIINDEDNIQAKIAAYYKLPKYISCKYSFSLLNPLFANMKKDNTYNFLFGKEFIRQIENSVGYDYVTVKSFSKLISNEMRGDIFDMFFEYDEICASDVVHNLHTSKTNAHAHLDSMLSQKLIYISSTQGRKYYYALNIEYMGCLYNKLGTLYKSIKPVKQIPLEERKRYDLPRKKRKTRDTYAENHSNEQKTMETPDD